MKKILFLGLILTLVFSVSASAQIKDANDFNHRQEMRSYGHRELTRSEKRHLHRNELRYHKAFRKARRDGFVSRHERRHLAKLRKHDRREAYRSYHNNHRRPI